MKITAKTSWGHQLIYVSDKKLNKILNGNGMPVVIAYHKYMDI